MFSTTSDYFNSINFLFNVHYKLEKLNNEPYLYMMGYGSKAKHIYMWVINYESNSNNSTMKAVVKPIYDSVDFIQISYLDY